MTIRVEFYGIARRRAGVDQTVLPLSGPVSLASVLKLLATTYPNFAVACLDRGNLQSGYVANIGGQQFVRDPDTLLPENTCLLILSADAAG